MERKEEHVEKAFRVEGRVQGVGFRWWTRNTARALGLRGWVRNVPDGAVEVHLVGPEASVDRMVEALHQGPDAARVARVREWGRASDVGPEEFEIRK